MTGSAYYRQDSVRIVASARTTLEFPRLLEAAAKDEARDDVATILYVSIPPPGAAASFFNCMQVMMLCQGDCGVAECIDAK